MKRIIAKMFFQFLGWRIDQTYHEKSKRSVLVMAPHTSNWDFVFGRMAFNIYGLKVKFLIKGSLFKGPLDPILRAMGGLPVDRNKKTNMTDAVAEMYKEKEQLCIVFTPEGTRSYNKEWKKGFYYIAQKANVPIILSYVDYKTRTGGFFKEEFIPTGDVDKDIETIKGFYKGIEGRVAKNSVY